MFAWSEVAPDAVKRRGGKQGNATSSPSFTAAKKYLRERTLTAGVKIDSD